MQKKAVFLDRDGVINEDFGYVFEKEKFVFKDGVFKALKFFQDNKYLLFIITNQSGINRGFYTKEQFFKLDNYMKNELLKQDVKITKTYFCPHRPDEFCECRKPKAKMIMDARSEFDVNLQSSILIGDKLSDMEAGQNAGIKKLFLLGDEIGDFVNVKSVYDIISKFKDKI